MKLFGDEKSKKRVIKAACVLIVCSVATMMVILALQVKPFISEIDGGDQPGSGDVSGGADGTTGESDPLKDPEIKDVTEDDLKRFAADRKQDYYTILVGGTDEDGTRTDTIMVVAFDVKNKSVNILSVPRDTLVDVPRAVKRINSGYAVGGIKELKKELRSVLGFDIDRYVILDFQAVEDIIDAFGGVYFDVPQDMKYDDPVQNLHIDIDKGYQKLGGHDFVNLARFRKGYDNGDIDRIKVQHDLLAAFAKQLISPSTIPKIPRMASILTKNVESDFTVGEMIALAVAGLSVDSDTIQMFTLPGYGETLQGQSYWIPYSGQLLKLINSHFNPSSKAITSLNLLNPDTMRPPKENPPEDGKIEEGGTSGETGDPEEAPPADGEPAPPDLFSGDEDPIELD